MSQKNYSGSIALTKLKSILTKVKNNAGQEVDAIVIPLDANYLVKGKPDENGVYAVYMNIRVVAKDEADQYGQHGFVSQSVDSKLYKDANEDQKEVFKKLPILGNIKDFSGGGGNDAAAASTSQTPIEPPNTEDLPF